MPYLGGERGGALARKCDIQYWLPCDVDRRTVTWLPKFIGRIGNQMFLGMGLCSWVRELHYNKWVCLPSLHHPFQGKTLTGVLASIQPDESSIFPVCRH